MISTFWKNKRVFITGHTGFKGTWLTFWLNKLGAKVTGYALDPVDGAMFDALNMDITDIRGDIRDADKLKAAFREAKPEILFHLAAQAFVGEGVKYPVDTYSTNVMGLVNALECVRMMPTVKSAVVVTSDKAYFGDCSKDGFTEERTALGALEPYSGSKSCQEIVVDSYRNAYFKELGVATARASNVVGGGDPYKDRLIPAMLDAFGNGCAIEIRNPAAIRPWQYILDCIDGYLTLAEALYGDAKYSDSWNFGPELAGMQVVEQIAKTLSAAWGESAEYKIAGSAVPLPEKDILKLDITKAKSKLSWKPRWTLDEILEYVVKFEKTRIAGATAAELYSAAIDTHMEKYQ